MVATPSSKGPDAASLMLLCLDSVSARGQDMLSYRFNKVPGPLGNHTESGYSTWYKHTRENIQTLVCEWTSSWLLATYEQVLPVLWGYLVTVTPQRWPLRMKYERWVLLPAQTCHSNSGTSTQTSQCVDNYMRSWRIQTQRLCMSLSTNFLKATWHNPLLAGNLHHLKNKNELSCGRWSGAAS